MNEWKDGIWYFGHPYTCLDENGVYVPGGEEANFRLCCYRSAKLIDAGYVIYSPISHTHPIHTAYPKFMARQEHQMWYELDNSFIEQANFTGIILAPLWEFSKGCVGERALFETLDRKVLLYKELGLRA